jgi:2-iminobutanoate/2-iminopropanoate deaminase
MKKNIIHSERAPKAIGPYSQAVLVGDTLFLSGQLGIDPKEGRIVDETVAGQARQAIENLKAVLEEADMTLSNVVKTTIFLASMADFKTVNEVYGKYFTADPPARATIQVAALPLGGKVEIEAIAHR